MQHTLSIQSFFSHSAKLTFLSVFLICLLLTNSNFAQNYGFGLNNAGQMGIGTTTFRVWSPIDIGQDDIVKISPNYNHNLALKADGTLLAWGNNSYGRLGDNTTTNRLSPVPVLNLTDVIDIAAGEEFSVAVKSNGTVWTWGKNARGQLGNGTSDGSSHLLPTQVPGLTNVIAVSAGYEFTLALKSDGTVWAWGQNIYGQIGNNTSMNNVKSPTKVLDLTDVVSIATGYNHSVALKSDGTVWFWGFNNHGQLGNGTLASPTKPRKSNISGVTQIASGVWNVAALKANGDVYVWGYNRRGIIGNNSVGSDVYSPKKSTISDVIELKMGGHHILARLNDGSIMSWGHKAYGQLGLGNIPIGGCDCKPLPSRSITDTGIVSMATGAWHSFALKPQISTPSGLDVSLMGTNVKLNFDSVTSSGVTSYVAIDPTMTGLGVPFDYEIQANQPAYDISTSADTSEGIEVCMQAPNLADGVDFNSLKIMHAEDGVLINRTTSRDSVRREICATVESLAPFVIAQQLTPGEQTVSVAGRVVDSKGRAVRNASVSISDSNGILQTSRTNGFGYYLFRTVAVENAYVFDVHSRRHTFPSRVIAINDFVKDLIFVAN